MMKYYQLRDDVTIRGRWHLSDVLLPSGAEPLLDMGIPLDNFEPLKGTISHSGLPLEFTLTSFNVPVTNMSLARAVSHIANADVQCLPIEVGNQNKYNVLNAIRVVPCIDETRSEFIKWTGNDHRADLAGQYRQVTKLVVSSVSIPKDANFFRIKDWLVALIISEPVKEVMESVGCFGAKFIEVQT